MKYTDPNWYTVANSDILFVLYPDGSLGTSSFRLLSEVLPLVKELGCDEAFEEATYGQPCFDYKLVVKNKKKMVDLGDGLVDLVPVFTT